MALNSDLNNKMNGGKKLIVLSGKENTRKTTALVKLADKIHKSSGVLLDAFYIKYKYDILVRLNGIKGVDPNISFNELLINNPNKDYNIYEKLIRQDSKYHYYNKKDDHCARRGEKLLRDCVFIFYYKEKLFAICTAGDSPLVIQNQINLTIDINININIQEINFVIARRVLEEGDNDKEKFDEQVDAILKSAERNFNLVKIDIPINKYSSSQEQEVNKIVDDIFNRL